jgi:rare lipoprotein A
VNARKSLKAIACLAAFWFATVQGVDAVETQPPAAPAAAASAGTASAGDLAALAESGVATVYAAAMEGRLTSSGEPYSATALTAAHRTLPLGSRVRVTHTRNGRTVIVRINDRWGGGAGRVVNLSRRAAVDLGMNPDAGTAPVQVDVVFLGDNARAAGSEKMVAAGVSRELPPRLEPRDAPKSTRCANEAAILGLTGDLLQAHVRGCMSRRGRDPK